MLFSSHAVDCHTTFWTPSIEIGQSVPFQLSLAVPTSSRIAEIPFAKLEVSFDDLRTPITIQHDESLTPSREGVEHVTIGDVGDASLATNELSTSLRWGAGATKVFSGAVSSATERQLSVSTQKLSWACDHDY